MPLNEQTSIRSSSQHHPKSAKEYPYWTKSDSLLQNAQYYEDKSEWKKALVFWDQIAKLDESLSATVGKVQEYIRDKDTDLTLEAFDLMRQNLLAERALFLDRSVG